MKLFVLSPLFTRSFVLASLAFSATLAASNLYAQSSSDLTPDLLGQPMALTVTGTATVQNDDVTTDNGKTASVKFSTKQAKVTTADIVKRIGRDLGTNFSASAKIYFNPTGPSVWIQDGTNAPVDASTWLTITLNPNSNAVWSGAFSQNDTAANVSLKYSGSYLTTLHFQEAGDNLTFTGIVKDALSLSGPDKNGNLTYTESISGTLAGDGTAEGPVAVGTITIRASGKGTLSPP